MPLFRYSIYVGCGLTHAPPKFRQSVEAFKQEVNSRICRVLCFLGIGSGASPPQIYSWDIDECVYKCDLVVAICNYASTGLGLEMGTQIEARHKPCLALAQERSKVSEMVPGATLRRHVEFRRYRHLLTDGVELVADKLRRMQEAETAHFPLFSSLQSQPVQSQAGKIAIAS